MGAVPVRPVGMLPQVDGALIMQPGGQAFAFGAVREAYKATPPCARRGRVPALAFACGRVPVVEGKGWLANTAERIRLFATRLPVDCRDTGSSDAGS